MRIGPVKLIPGGWRVGETETHFVDIVVMLYNHRVCLTPKASPEGYDRAWCYPSKEAAVLAVAAWEPDTDAEPVGWIKEAGTNRYGDAARAMRPLPAHAKPAS